MMPVLGAQAADDLRHAFEVRPVLEIGAVRAAADGRPERRILDLLVGAGAAAPVDALIGRQEKSRVEDPRLLLSGGIDDREPFWVSVKSERVSGRDDVLWRGDSRFRLHVRACCRRLDHAAARCTVGDVGGGIDGGTIARRGMRYRRMRGGDGGDEGRSRQPSDGERHGWSFRWQGRGFPAARMLSARRENSCVVFEA